MPKMIAPLRQSAVVLARSPLFFRLLRYVVAGRFSPLQYRYLEPHLSGKILDIGCGTGEMAHYIRNPYVGIDVDTTFLPSVLRYAPHARVVTATGSALPFCDRTFDTAIFISALHHCSDIEALSIFRESARCASRMVLLDMVPPRHGFLRRFLHNLDRGRYMRSASQQRTLLSRVFSVHEEKYFWSSTRLYEWVMFVCEADLNRQGA